MSRILVIGASGNVGTQLVRDLKVKGHDVVRATSREEVEADQVHLNLLTRDGLHTAFEGVRRAFLLEPPGLLAMDEMLGPVFEKAAERRLEKVVLMTAMGANADPNAPARKAELLLENVGVPWNVIRPNWFMQNFNSYWLHDINVLGKIQLPTSQAKGSYIDVRDIAAVAAELLDSERFSNTEFDLTGARALDHVEVATIIARETSRDIRYQDIQPDEMLKNLLGAGVRRSYAEFLVTILGYFKAGYSQRTTESVLQITGKTPIGFEQYAHDYRGSWLR